MILETFFTEAQEKYSAHLVAGGEGLKRQITWFHIIEDSILSTFIHGDELVFSAGLFYQDEKWLMDLVKKLYEHNACGIIINLGPYIKYIPQQVICFCDQNDFPLLTVPWRIKLVDVTRRLSQMILENERTHIQSTTAFKNVILSPEPIGSLNAQLAEIGYQYDSQYCVAIISASAINPENIEKKIKLVLSKSYDDFVLFHLNALIVIIFISSDIDKIRTHIKAIYSALTKDYKNDSIYIGVSKNQQNITSIHSSHQQAERALSLAKVEERKNYVFYEDSGIYKLLFQINDKQLLKEFVDEILGEILDFDKSHKTEYLKWLKLYLECDTSIQIIAQKAFCHRNTVNYKLKRMRELFDLNTDSVREKSMILTALDIIPLLDCYEKQE